MEVNAGRGIQKQQLNIRKQVWGAIVIAETPMDLILYGAILQGGAQVKSSRVNP